MIVAFIVTVWLLAIASGAKPGTDRANARLDAVRTGLAAGAGTGAAVGLMLAFRRQHHQEMVCRCAGVVLGEPFQPGAGHWTVR